MDSVKGERAIENIIIKSWLTRGASGIGSGTRLQVRYMSENLKVGEVRAALPSTPGNVKLACTLGTGVAATGPITTATAISFTPRRVPTAA